MRNKGSYHVNQWFWSILQKFRGFKLICKYYFMHKVKKKANIIIETNKPISWVKSTIYDGLNKQPNLLGKINPKCVLSYIYPAQIGLHLTQCFLEYAEFFSLLCCAKLKQMAESGILFFRLILQKIFRMK